MPWINCKIHLELNWIEDCTTNFKITDANLHVPRVTLSTKDNVNLTKQLMDLKDMFIETIIKLVLQKQ